MSTTPDDVVETIRTFLVRIKKNTAGELTADTALYGGGIGLDSLDAAELSALLEDRHGKDPYSEGDSPETVGDILAFYR